MKRILVVLEKGIKCPMSAIVTLNVLSSHGHLDVKDLLERALEKTTDAINAICDDTPYLQTQETLDGTILDTIEYIVNVFKSKRNSSLLKDITNRRITRISLNDKYDPTSFRITCV